MNIFFNMKWRFFYVAFFFLLGMGLCYPVHAQEFLTGIGKNAQIIKEYQLKKNLSRERTDNQPLTLPFFEDFSNYTGYPNAALFVDSQAFANNSFPVRPPTIGVVTLDAIDKKGKLYSHLNEVSKGADTLTSRYIRLDSLRVADTLRAIKFDEDALYFSFYFQPGGAGIKAGDVAERIGSQPNINDSLVLEFGYLKVEKDTAYTVWNHIWSTPGFSVDEWISDTLTPHQYFKQVLIPITNTNYSCSTFQFRFRNYVSLEPQQGIPGWEGNVDQWHIDYIRLDVGRNDEDVFTNDLAFVSPTTSFLKNYQSMAWKHFQSTDMKSNFKNELTNLNNGKRTPKYKYTIEKNGIILSEYTQQWLGAADINPYFSDGLYVNDPVTKPPISFIPNLSGADTGTFVITHIFTNNSGDDFCNSNDTCIYKQKFYDYFAYDDGTAEYGYCLNNQYNVAKLAMKFTLRETDSLSAVRMWLNSTKNSENKEATFRFFVWADDNEQPGAELFKTEVYKPDTSRFHDFAEYKFDKKYSIKEAHKTFWIGFEQHGNVQLNIGFDQNNDSREFFKYNTNGTWRTSSFKGTPMLRPVFGEPLHFAKVPTPNISDINVYPNPTTGQLTISFAELAPTGAAVDNGQLTIKSVEVFDVLGKKQLSIVNCQLSIEKMDISDLSNGVYFVKIETETGIITKKIIKN